MKILYVEDNAANARLLAKYLALQGDVELLEAASGEAGVALARAELPDLVLMDINLPHMSGTEALAALRADARTAGIAVIAVSADALPDRIQAARAAGFDDYLTTPLDLATLEAVITRYRAG
ncbi:MAG: response regulator [Gammaproteobacteria bacterium]|nr:response regulator [Gammaproteobacteria bacterium]